MADNSPRPIYRHTLDVGTEPQGLRDRKKAATRAALARAAADLMLEEGAEGTTIASIAQRANVSSRTFHNYFPHREAAFLFFIDSYVDQVIRWVDEAEPGLATTELLRRLAKEIMINPDAQFAPVSLVSTLGEHLGLTMSPEESQVLVVLFSKLTARLREYNNGALSMLEIHLLLNATMAVINAATEVLEDENINTGHSFEEMIDLGFDRLATGFEN